MKRERRRKKRIRNAVCVVYSCLQLLLVLLAFQGIRVGLNYLVLGNQADEMETVVIDSQLLPEEQRELLVCIDAGHGGKDVGSDYKKRLEKDDNLKVALALKAYLEGQNVGVVMTREDDSFLSLAKRCQMANEAKADYFVSLHRNKGDGFGVETWVYSDASDETMALAQGIMTGLEEAGTQRNRGVRKGTQKSENKNYYVNTHSDMPACIVELGFINNTKDNQLLDDNIEQYVAAMGEAIIAAASK